MTDKIELYGGLPGSEETYATKLSAALLCFDSPKLMREFAAFVLEAADECELDSKYHDHFGFFGNDVNISLHIIDDSNRETS